MTVSDIPLRDLICEIVFRETVAFADERSQLLPEDACYAIADALLARFDIQLRSPHPNEEKP